MMLCRRWQREVIIRAPDAGRGGNAFLPEGRAGGRQAMEETLGQLRRMLLRALEADRAVSPAAFDDCFTREQLAAFVLDSLLGQLSRGADSCGGLEQVLRRLLYR